MLDSIQQKDMALVASFHRENKNDAPRDVRCDNFAITSLGASFDAGIGLYITTSVKRNTFDSHCLIPNENTSMCDVVLEQKLGNGNAGNYIQYCDAKQGGVNTFFRFGCIAFPLHSSATFARIAAQLSRRAQSIS